MLLLVDLYGFPRLFCREHRIVGTEGWRAREWSNHDIFQASGPFCLGTLLFPGNPPVPLPLASISFFKFYFHEGFRTCVHELMCEGPIVTLASRVVFVAWNLDETLVHGEVVPDSAFPSVLADTEKFYDCTHARKEHTHLQALSISFRHCHSKRTSKLCYSCLDFGPLSMAHQREGGKERRVGGEGGSERECLE